MASITDKGGVKTIQLVAPDGRRVSISLGRADGATAAAFARWTQSVADSLKHGHPLDVRATRWLAGLPDRLHARVSRAGLDAPRASVVAASATLLAPLCDAYLAKRTDIEPGSLENVRKGRNNLVEFFSPDLDVAKIQPAQADDFKRWLLAKYSRATTSQRIKRAKMIFRDAVRRRLIESSPFDDVVAGSEQNSARDRFIDRETIDKVIDACPSLDWRLAVALSRYGGLRIPSELRTLRWVDVLFDERKVIIHATKTRKIEGKAVRVLPMFPELEPLLRQAFDAAEEGAEFVLSQRLRGHTNLATTFVKIIKRAGFAPWPRLWHNLRGSRQTELCDTYPLHVVCDWLGNDPKTAMKHYLRTTKDHFARATATASETSARTSAATGGNASRPNAANPAFQADPAGFAIGREAVRTVAMADLGGNWHRWDSNP